MATQPTSSSGFPSTPTTTTVPMTGGNPTPLYYASNPFAMPNEVQPSFKQPQQQQFDLTQASGSLSHRRTVIFTDHPENIQMRPYPRGRGDRPHVYVEPCMPTPPMPQPPRRRPRSPSSLDRETLTISWLIERTIDRASTDTEAIPVSQPLQLPIVTSVLPPSPAGPSTLKPLGSCLVVLGNKRACVDSGAIANEESPFSRGGGEQLQPPSPGSVLERQNTERHRRTVEKVQNYLNNHVPSRDCSNTQTQENSMSSSHGVKGGFSNLQHYRNSVQGLNTSTMNANGSNSDNGPSAYNLNTPIGAQAFDSFMKALSTFGMNAVHQGDTTSLPKATLTLDGFFRMQDDINSIKQRVVELEALKAFYLTQVELLRSLANQHQAANPTVQPAMSEEVARLLATLHGGTVNAAEEVLHQRLLQQLQKQQRQHESPGNSTNCTNNLASLDPPAHLNGQNVQMPPLPSIRHSPSQTRRVVRNARPSQPPQRILSGPAGASRSDLQYVINPVISTTSRPKSKRKPKSKYGFKSKSKPK
ncbi:hypothetical protein BV898_05208 [Hypsibius exemplaris]|uniref:Uncharacterized protein n=1 Tax=Hypsibius exemplaris TaxID=2072580 RepID=A0A1W0X064_HYPEX|nr:hypothetical protein BV898_05208 [Hypsibius exemplaris]